MKSDLCIMMRPDDSVFDNCKTAGEIAVGVAKFFSNLVSVGAGG